MAFNIFNRKEPALASVASITADLRSKVEQLRELANQKRVERSEAQQEIANVRQEAEQKITELTGEVKTITDEVVAADKIADNIASLLGE